VARLTAGWRGTGLGGANLAAEVLAGGWPINWEGRPRRRGRKEASIDPCRWVAAGLVSRLLWSGLQDRIVPAQGSGVRAMSWRSLRLGLPSRSTGKKRAAPAGPTHPVCSPASRHSAGHHAIGCEDGAPPQRIGDRGGNFHGHRADGAAGGVGRTVRLAALGAGAVRDLAGSYMLACITSGLACPVASTGDVAHIARRRSGGRGRLAAGERPSVRMLAVAQPGTTRRTQRCRWPQPKMSRIVGRHRACACGALCLAAPESCDARQSQQVSTQMNANKPR
jgi:hypothetical protein